MWLLFRTFLFTVFLVLKAGHSTCYHRLAKFHTPITQHYVPNSQKAGIPSFKERDRIWDPSVPTLLLPTHTPSPSALGSRARKRDPSTERCKACRGGPSLVHSVCACRALFTLTCHFFSRLCSISTELCYQISQVPLLREYQQTYRAGISVMHRCTNVHLNWLNQAGDTDKKLLIIQIQYLQQIIHCNSWEKRNLPL